MAAVEFGKVIAQDGDPDLVFVAAGPQIVSYVGRSIANVPISGNAPSGDFVGLAFAGVAPWAVTESGSLYRFESEGCE